MKLVKPSLQYQESYRKALDEYKAEGFIREWTELSRQSLEGFVQACKDHEKGKNLPDHWVPATMYWLIDNDQFIGQVQIRHELNDHLKQEGGHIGYSIRPTERQKGYGKMILALALPKACEKGIKKALVTCDENNVFSAKIIEHNGGVLQDKVIVEGKMVRRYWIDLNEWNIE